MAASTQYELIKTENEIETALSPEKSLDVETAMAAGTQDEHGQIELEGGGGGIQPNKLMIFRVSGPPTLELPESLMSAVWDKDIYAEYKEMKSHNEGEDPLIKPLKLDFSLTNSLPYFHPVLNQVQLYNLYNNLQLLSIFL